MERKRQATNTGAHPAAACNRQDVVCEVETRGLIEVTVIWPQLGSLLGLVVAEAPARLSAFLAEAERLDQGYKRWEYVRGALGVPGFGAQLVGTLPAGLHYTGFEGYWAGSGLSAEAIVAAEAELGTELIATMARMTGAAHALAAGLDVFRHPHMQALYDTAVGKNDDLSNILRLEPVFGALLARLRAMEESEPFPERAFAFQSAVEAAVAAVPPSIYLDPDQGKLLTELANEGGNVTGADLVERYTVPRAPATIHHSNTVQLTSAQQRGYRIMGEIGRLGDPAIRALLHILPDAMHNAPTM